MTIENLEFCISELDFINTLRDASGVLFMDFNGREILSKDSKYIIERSEESKEKEGEVERFYCVRLLRLNGRETNVLEKISFMYNSERDNGGYNKKRKVSVKLNEEDELGRLMIKLLKINYKRDISLNIK
ncbi:MAG: hypothetical protein WC781_01100 [Candidatus Pacearchaeota archaeon]|jgi:hypothetical protein